MELFKYLLSIVLISSSTVQAEEVTGGAGVDKKPACEAALHPAPSPDDQWSQMSDNERVQQILLMIGSNGLPAKDRGEMFEKGVLYLGIPGLSGKFSLVLEYRRNGFNQPEIYRLARIELVEYNNSTTDSIAKRPFDESGKLVPLVFKDANVAANFPGLAFPAEINGYVLNSVQRSQKWLEYVQPKEIKRLAIGHSNVLRLLGQKRRFQGWAINRFNKFAFGIALAGIVFSVLPMGAHLPHTSLVSQFFATQKDADKTQAELSIHDLLTNKSIAVSERQWLKSQFDQSDSTHQAQNDVVFDGKDLKILSTDRPGEYWILTPSNNRLFATTLALEVGNAGADLNMSTVIEIPKDQMPQTYTTVTHLFEADSGG